MIYGLNFGGEEIPPGVKSKFRERISLEKSPAGRTFKWLRLQGVATSFMEWEEMMGDVVRPGRVVRTVERKTAGGVWYGIYVH